MKRFKNWHFAALLIVASMTLAYAANYVQRFTVAGTQVWLIDSDGSTQSAGPTRYGNNALVTSVTMPSTLTGSQFAQQVPVYNVGAAVTLGDVLISSNTGTGYVMIAPALSDQKNVVGVAAASIASGAKGWMVPLGGGYAVIHTTGTVAIGDILVTTITASGYATTNNSPTSGTIVGKAMSAGTASGGSTLAIMQ